MNPDLEKRVPREILEDLIEEGTEAFRGVLEKLFNVAIQLERSEFLGAEAYERTASRRGYRNGFKGKRIQTRVGEQRLEIPQVRGLSFYPKSLERGVLARSITNMLAALTGMNNRRQNRVTTRVRARQGHTIDPPMFFTTRNLPGCRPMCLKRFSIV